MSFFARMSPIRAINDLRSYLAGRPSYELVFLMLAIVITGFLIYLFARNDYGAPPYRPDIVYVEQWPLNRTDAQIRAAQVVDQKVKEKRLAELKAAQEKRKAEFKKVDDALSRWGI
jgi:hypothetical protein